MTTWVKPVPVSELENAHTQFDGQYDDAREEDCVPDSLISLIAAAKPGVVATHTAGEILRDAAGYGPMGATMVEKYPAAIKSIYGLTLKVLSGVSATTLLAALTPGMGASIIGQPSRCPTGSPFRRFLPNFTAYHEVTIANLGVVGQKWLVDPMAPKGTYTGEWVTDAEVRAFFTGSAGLLPLMEGTPLIFEKVTKPGRFTVTAGKVAKGLTFDPATGAYAPTAKSLTTGGGHFDFYYKRVPAGDPPTIAFHVTDGTLAGLYVNSAEIDEVFDASPTYADGYRKAIADAAALAAATASKITGLQPV